VQLAHFCAKLNPRSRKPPSDLSRVDRMEMARRLSIFLVSVYLLAVGIWLLATHQIVVPGLPKLLRRFKRPRYVADLSEFYPDSGHCWVVITPEFLLSDKERLSSLKLFEDDVPLGPSECGHDEIRALGAGRYSHWGERVFLSTSDNSDPASNGRRYRLVEA
jgi:hypothetical protein